jgi:ArsR family transcriptional regulator
MPTTTRFIKIARALSDPQRVAMLERIAKDPEVACRTLVEEFHITPATISHHVKELVEAGLIEYRKSGKCAYFKAKPAALAKFQADLSGRFAVGKPNGRAIKRSAARGSAR